MPAVYRCSGFPPGYSNIKTEVFLKNTARNSNVTYKKLDGKELEFISDADAEKFIRRLSEIKFGGKTYNIKLGRVFAEHRPKLTDPVLNLDVKHSWFDLEDFPSNQRQSVILVKFTEAELTPQDVCQHFQADTNGGPIERAILMLDGILIIFQHDEVADRVLQRPILSIKGSRVRLFRKTVPELHRDKLIRTNGSVGALPENEVKDEIENLSPFSTRPEEVLPNGNVSIVCYKSSLGDTEFEAVLKRAQERNFDRDSKVLPFPKTDCISVNGLPQKFELTRLQTTLEKNSLTKGATVTKMDRAKTGETLVYFGSYKHVDEIMERYRAIPVRKFDCTLHFQPYSHCLSDIHLNLIDQNVVEGSVEREVDERILNFFTTRNRHFEKLKRSFKDFGSLEFVNNPEKCSILATLASADASDNDFKDTCDKKFEEFFSDFVIEKREGFIQENLEKARQERTHQYLDQNGVDDSTKDFTVEWTGHKKDVLIVTGVKHEVKSVVDELSNLINASRENIVLTKGKYRWLIESGSLSNLQEVVGDCKIECDDKTHSVTLVGNQAASTKTHLEIFKVLERVRSEKFSAKNEDVARYFSTTTKVKEIEDYVNNSLPKNLKALFTIEDGVPHLWCYEDRVKETAMHMERILVVDKTIQLTDAQNEETKTNEWVQERNELQDNLLVSLSIQTQRSKVVIVGFREKVEITKQRVKAFFEEHIIHKISFPVSFGGAQYILNHVAEFKDCPELNEISYGYEYEENALFLQGKRSSVDKVLGILKNQDIVEEEKTWSFYNILHHFEKGNGKTILSRAQSDNQCIVLIEGTFPKPPKLKPRPIPRSIQRLASLQRAHSRRRANSTQGIRKLIFAVAEGDITTYHTDGIVNCVGNDFSLSTAGLLSEALLKKGGPSIQTELQSIKQGQVRVTSAGNLNCTYIMHANFTDGSSTIKSRLKEVLQMAEEKKCKTLAIPAIGTGKMSKSAPEMAKLMYETLCDYRNSTTTKFLEKVEIVVFNSAIVPAFKSVFVDPVPTKQVTSVKVGPLQLTVRKGDITKEKSDAIVNSLGSDFDMTKGGQLSSLLLKSGGDDIQKELSSANGTEIRVTGGGKLPCSKIIHAVVPSARDKLKEVIKEILTKGEVEKCRSISFPTIGAGIMKVSGDVLAKAMREAFAEWAKKNPITMHLIEVNLVIFEDSLHSKFLKELIIDPMSQGSATAAPEINIAQEKAPTYSKMSNFGVDEEGFIQISANTKIMGPIEVTVLKGDITEQTTDAIVNSTGHNFDVSFGLVSRRIIEKGGQEIAKELSRAVGRRMRVTDAGNLKCKKIIHVPSTNNSDQLKQSVKNILQQAEVEQCSSVAIPAIGTGKKNLASDVVAGIIREALTEFAQENSSTSSLRKVHIVIFDDGQYQTFIKQLFGYRSRSNQSCKALADDFRNPHEISLYFYCAKSQKQKITKAIKDISDHIHEAFCSEVIPISELREILTCKFEELSKILSQSGTGYIIDGADGTVTLSGLRGLVANARIPLAQLTSNVSNTMKLQSLTSHSWKYKFNDRWVEFDGFFNILLEEAKANKKQFQTVEVPVSGSAMSFTVNMDERSMRSKDGRFKLEVRRDRKEELPSEWEQMGDEINYKLVAMDSSSAEFQRVAKKIHETVKNAKIQSISRIQNRTLYLRYQQERSRVEKTCQYRPFERELFHGTSAESCEKIANEGFNRTYAGDANAKAFGWGVYFAKYAQYSNDPKYSKPDGKNIKRMFLANVVTGEYCEGKSSMKAAPTKKNSKEQFNSAVNRLSDPTIFVVFTDVGVYPAYLIKYSA